MKVSREFGRKPPRGLFRRIANRKGWAMGWMYWAEGRSRDGYHVTGMGRTAREAINDLTREREPAKGASDGRSSTSR